MKVLPSADSDAESLSSPSTGLKLTSVPPPSLSSRPEPILPSSLSFCRLRSQRLATEKRIVPNNFNSLFAFSLFL